MGPLFTAAEAGRRLDAMRQAIDQIEKALNALGKDSPWSNDIQASDEFLEPLFRAYFEKLGLQDLIAKKNFYEMVEHIPIAEIDAEIREKLDTIARVAEGSTPA